jgi:alpha-tubulin suppressor-like RCC1 family protein
MEGGLAVCSWGAGHFGQLGLGSESSPFVEHPTVVESLLPHAVGSPIASVAAGWWHSMALTQEGIIFSFGCNRSGQCGMNPTRDPPTICNPRVVKFDNISSSNHRTATTSSSATSTSSSSSTSSYSSSKVIRIEKIVGGRSHSVALDHAGQGTYINIMSFGDIFTILDRLYLTMYFFSSFFFQYTVGVQISMVNVDC